MTGAQKTKPAGDLVRGDVTSFVKDGLNIGREVRCVEPLEGTPQVLILFAGGATLPLAATTPVPLVDEDEREEALSRARQKLYRERAEAFLRKLADLVRDGLPIPRHGFTVGGCVDSAEDVELAAKLLGSTVKDNSDDRDHPYVTTDFHFGLGSWECPVDVHYQFKRPTIEPAGGAA